MEGSVAAAGDGSDPSRRSGKRRRAAPYGDDARDGVNAVRDAVAPRQEEEPDHQVPGRGNGGGDGLGTWPVRQNPIPLQNKNRAAHGVSDIREEVAPPRAEQPDHLALWRGNGGGVGQQHTILPQNNQDTSRAPPHQTNPWEVIRKRMDDVHVEDLRQQVIAGGEPRMPSILRTSQRLLGRVRFQPSSSSPRGDGRPRCYRVSEDEYHRGMNMLAVRAEENGRLRLELAASEEECASLREEVRQANETAFMAEATVGLLYLGLGSWELGPLRARRGGGTLRVDEANLALVCGLCGIRPATVVLRPCGHCCLCSPCSTARRMCPSCRAPTTD